MVKSAVFETPTRLAVRVTLVTVATERALTLKLAETAPCGTVTLAGMEVAALSLESVTTVPPTGAPLSRVTVPVADCPSMTDVGLTVRETRGGGTGLTCSVAVFEPEP
jgi:hypothetical protein